MRIFYLSDGHASTGGQRVNVEHVRALRRMGYDAGLLVVQPPDQPQTEPEFASTPGLAWRRHPVRMTAEDVVVLAEGFGFAALQMADSPARKLIHNQNLFYSFLAFRDLDALRGWGCEAILCASRFTAEGLKLLGWDRPLHLVRPFVDPLFAAAPQDRAPERRIAAIPRKRPIELRLIRGALRSRRPDLANVAWIELEGRAPVEVARVLGASDIFLSLGHNEGLGLPPLEAMAASALVVGYHGGGGQEYATAENGDWFDDGQALAIADRLAERLEQLAAGETFEARREAGRRTAAAFNAERFEAELGAAWAQIAGPPPRAAR